MKLFVTGGTGFIGSNFLNQVLNAGHHVVAQRRPGSSPRVNLIKEPIWIDRVLDQDFQSELIGCDAVVHLASHTPNPPYASLDECLYWNVFATTRFLQQAIDQGIRDVIIAGTCFEYGIAAEGHEFVHPATESRPSLSYPISKAAATTACLGLARQNQLRLQVLRIFQVYGEGEAASRFWPSLRSAAFAGRDFEMSSGLQVRDFISVTEVANQLTKALDFEHIEPGKPHIRNVGTGKAQTLFEFAQDCWFKWNAKGKLIPGKVSLRPSELKRMVADVKNIHIC